MRMACVVPDISGTSLPRKDLGGVRNEAWCQAMLLFFHPWRTFEGLKDNAQSWSQSFENTTFDPFHKNIMENMEVMNDSKEARD
ncbi:hypothetical protein CALCODRAFT_415108, partial [Calocera cornea HHB12733]